jgi:methionyl-tRNA formyltransferase
VPQAIYALESGTARPLPQDAALAFKAPRIKKADGQVDWNRPAEAVRNHVRAMEPWPRAYTFWHRAEGPPVRLILGPVEVASDLKPNAPPGTVVKAPGERIVVAVGDGTVIVHTLQPAGKRMMEVREFLRGHRVAPGERFGPE